MIQVDDTLSIGLVDRMWIVEGGRINKVTFSRLQHACRYIVDNWASDKAVGESASMIDVVEHMGDRLHDAITLVGKAHSLDSKRLDWVMATRERGTAPYSREAIDAAMERDAGVRASEV